MKYVNRRVSSDISGYHVDFHEGHDTFGAGQGRGMACVNYRTAWQGIGMCAARARHGSGTGAARARQGRGMLCVNRPLMGFFHPGVVEILIIDSFGLLKSCGVRMNFSQAYTLRKSGRTLKWVSYRPLKSLETNVEEFKIFNY